MKSVARFLLSAALAAIGCASVTTWNEAAGMERSGAYAEAAHAYEKVARRFRGPTQAEAWYRAGLAWVDPKNPRKSFGRGLACFRRVEEEDASRETARGARAWVAVLDGLVSAREAAQEADRLRRAMEDVQEGAEALQGR